MAVVNTKSTAVTNGDTTPQKLNPMAIAGGRVKEHTGFAEIANGDSIGSTIRLCRVKSSDRVSRVLLSCDAVASAAADIGLYETAAKGGAAVDVDFFASAQALTAALVHQDVTHEADPAGAGAGFAIQDTEQKIWEALGLTSDPGKEYDVTLTLTAAATGAGTVGLKVQCVDGN